MNILSESLTIGLLLMLVFGALFFYIYSRVMYIEKRISLMENILLDIKMNQEQMPTHVLPPVPPSTRFQELVEEQVFHEPMTMTEEDVIDLKEDEQVNELYTNMLEEAHNSAVITEQPDTSSKVRVNYESMTKDELIEIAKKKGLRTGNKPGRDKLLQMIHKSEEVIDGVNNFETLQEVDA